MHVLYTYGVALMAALAQPGRAQQEAPSDDPIPDPTAAVALGNARFTVLSESLIRLQSVTPRRDGHQQQPDDRATAVVVNRRFPGGVPQVQRVSSERIGSGDNDCQAAADLQPAGLASTAHRPQCPRWR